MTEFMTNSAEWLTHGEERKDSVQGRVGEAQGHEEPERNGHAHADGGDASGGKVDPLPLEKEELIRNEWVSEIYYFPAPLHWGARA